MKLLYSILSLVLLTSCFKQDVALPGYLGSWRIVYHKGMSDSLGNFYFATDFSDTASIPLEIIPLDSNYFSIKKAANLSDYETRVLLSSGSVGYKGPYSKSPLSHRPGTGDSLSFSGLLNDHINPPGLGEFRAIYDEKLDRIVGVLFKTQVFFKGNLMTGTYSTYMYRTNNF